MADDIVIGGLTLRKEVAIERCATGRRIEFTWWSLYEGTPDPHSGPLAKFKYRHHAALFGIDMLAAAPKENK